MTIKEKIKRLDDLKLEAQLNIRNKDVLKAAVIIITNLQEATLAQQTYFFPRDLQDIEMCAEDYLKCNPDVPSLNIKWRLSERFRV